MPQSSPTPRTSFTISKGARVSLKSARNSSPRRNARGPSSSRSSTSNVANPARTGCQITKGHAHGILQKWIEPVPPEFVVHQRQSARGQPMKTVLRVDNPWLPRGCAGKLDCRFSSFAAAASEVNFPESSTCHFAQPLCQFTRELWLVALQHCGTTPVQFVFSA